MAPQVPPLDEVEWADPTVLRNFSFSNGQLDSNSILWYFMNSPFFDPQSNNNSLAQQVANSPDRDALFFNRHAFEEALRTRYSQGVQFVVVAEPQAPGQPFVIQKQNKQLVIGDDGARRIETQIQGVYYTVGEKILMAPSLLDVVQSRLLSVSTTIQEFFTLGRDLSHYTPSTGHTYLPPSYEASKPTTAAGTASRAGSLAPTDIDLPQSTNPPSTDPTTGTEETFSDEFFLQSLLTTNKYGHEYADENPLQGEPGSFVFASTTSQVEARNKAAAAAHATGASLSIPAPHLKPPGEGDNSALSSVAPTPRPLPQVVGDAVGSSASRKGSVASLGKSGVAGTGTTKKERRKSKGGGLASPTSPKAPIA